MPQILKKSKFVALYIYNYLWRIDMYIKRERYLDKIRPFYEVDLIKVLTGVRRCGKSILLSQIEDEFKENGVADGSYYEPGDKA